PFDATAFCARTERPRRHRRPVAAAGEPACAASRLRQPPAAQRRRSSHRADPAWSQRYLNHADLHACRRRALEESGARSASIGGKITFGCLLLQGAERRRPSVETTPVLTSATVST